MAARSESGSWRDELTALGRALAGAFLFGTPLLFTMEMWWIGSYADLWKLLVLLGLAFVANVVLAYFSGFKHKQSAKLSEVLEQAVDAVAIGAIASLLVLIVLNRVTFGDPLDSVLGKIIVQTVPLSIGASLANAVFGKGEGRSGDDDQQPERHEWRELLNDLGATTIGGIFIGFSVAPTEEVPMLAAEMHFPHELALIGLSLAIAYIIVFVSGFDPQVAMQRDQPGPFQHPITETSLSYLVSLVVALVSLYLFDRIEFGDPLYSVIMQVLVLGLPTTVGGAAGRLAV